MGGGKTDKIYETLIFKTLGITQGRWAIPEMGECYNVQLTALSF